MPGELILQQEVLGQVLHPTHCVALGAPSANSCPHCAGYQRTCFADIDSDELYETETLISPILQRGKPRQRRTCLESYKQEATMLGTGPRPRDSRACILTPLLTCLLGTLGIAEIKAQKKSPASGKQTFCDRSWGWASGFKSRLCYLLAAYLTLMI